MKHFFIKLLTVISILIIVDFSFGYIYDRLFNDIKGNDEISLIYRALYTEKADILVLGPSSAKHHYNPKVIEASLGLKTFNAGMDARDVIYSDVLFQAFLSRNNLRFVFLDVGSSSLDGSWKNNPVSLRYFYGRNQIITDFYNNEGDFWQKLKLKCKLYKYNGSLSLLRFVFFDSAPDSLSGYLPLYGSLSSLDFTTNNSFVPDSDCVNHLERIVNTCKEKGIQLAIIHSPHCVNNECFKDWIKTFCDDHKVLLILENEDSYWRTHPELFKDRAHLNSSGADELSKRVSGYFLHE